MQLQCWGMWVQPMISPHTREAQGMVLSATANLHQVLSNLYKPHTQKQEPRASSSSSQLQVQYQLSAPSGLQVLQVMS